MQNGIADFITIGSGDDKFIACSEPNHDLNQWWLINNWTFDSNKIQIQTFSFNEMHLQIWSKNAKKMTVTLGHNVLM